MITQSQRNTEPCVFIYGPEETVVNNIIYNVAGAAVPGQSSISPDLACFYPWRVDNKYYTADVQLCHVLQKFLPHKHLADRCEAVIIWFNSDQADGLDSVDSVLAFTKQFEPDVCMLVCESCDDNTPVSRLRAQQWCVNHGFELVELTPSEEPDPDDDFPETTGVQRISQALQAHTWSNLVLKEVRHPAPTNKLLDEMTPEWRDDQSAPAAAVTSEPDNGQACAEAAEHSQMEQDVDALAAGVAGLAYGDDPDPGADPLEPAAGAGAGADSRPSGPDNGPASAGADSRPSGPDNGPASAGAAEGSRIGELPDAAKKLFTDGGLEAYLADPAVDEEAFEKLFSELARMRAAAERMPAGQRHRYAESVATSFLHALGGEEGEDSD